MNEPSMHKLYEDLGQIVQCCAHQHNLIHFPVRRRGRQFRKERFLEGGLSIDIRYSSLAGFNQLKASEPR
jgi:hypothetical protein